MFFPSLNKCACFFSPQQELCRAKKAIPYRIASAVFRGTGYLELRWFLFWHWEKGQKGVAMLPRVVFFGGGIGGRDPSGIQTV